VRASQRLPPQSQQPLAHLEQQQEKEQGGQVPKVQGLSFDNTCFGVAHGFREVAKLVQAPVTSACRIRDPLEQRPVLLGAEMLDDAAKNTKAWNDMPPVGDLQPLGKLKPGAVVLLDAKAGTRQVPLLVWEHYGRGTSYMLATGSTWRWKMRLPHEDQRHFTFWRQLLHAVAADAPPRLSITTGDKVFDDQRRVPLNAEIRNEKFEPVNDATVAVTVAADDGTTMQVQMVPSGQGDGRYTASVEAPSTGLYRVSMTASARDKDLGSLETHFRR